MRLAITALLLCSAAQAAPVRIAEWHVIGPFEAGSREGQVHPLAEAGGRLPPTWDFSRTWPSALTDGGRVSWRTVSGEMKDGALTGEVKLELTGVAWEAREDEWGAAAASNVAVLAGSFELESDVLLLIDATRCSGTIGGQPFMGDPYGAGIARSVVRGRKGRNEVVLLSGGFGPSRSITFRAETIDPSGPEVMIAGSDVLVPDAMPGQQVAGIPLLNLTDEWLAVTLRADGLPASETKVTLAPMSPLKVPLRLGRATRMPQAVRVTTSRGEIVKTFKPEMRKPGEPYRVTFLSGIDGSAQEYGVRPPSDGERPGQSMLLSTHGAGVDALGQVSAYGPKAGVTIVAPTNRRPYGFDWHDWGRLDFEEVRGLALQRFRPDPDRVHLTGHSMGGHGAWILGALHADEFATVSPSAAWASYDTYVPFTTRRSTWLASPELNALLLRGLGTARVSPLLENLAHVPVQVLHGGKDDNVPPTQARMLVGLLERLGGNVTYVEAPSEGHWSDLDLNRPGADSVDPAIMDRFWGARDRDPLPRRFVFATPDPDVDAVRHWVRIDAQDTIASESRIEADATSPERVTLRTRNVRALSIRTAGLGLAADAALIVDGDTVRLIAGDSWLPLERGSSGWMHAPRPMAPIAQPNARPGGLAKALFTPFVIVLPTQGDPARCESLAGIGRLIATAWWVRANGYARMIRDVDVTAEWRRGHGLLLLGGPELNAETARVQRSLSIVATSDGARLFGRRMAGADLACAHWQPSPDAPERRLLVLQATSAEGDLLLPGLQPIAAGVGLPDFAIASPMVRIAGFGGFVAAGFWAPDWSLDPSSTWLAAGAEQARAAGARPPADKNARAPGGARAHDRSRRDPACLRVTCD